MLDITLTRQLLAEGWTTGEIARLLADGRLDRVRRGAYGPVLEQTAEDRHLRLVRACLQLMPSGGALSHVSAALLHGFPVWGVPLSRVHLTRDQPGGGKVRRWVHLHVAPLPAGQLAHLDGHAVTSGARTVVDLLRALPPELAVPIGDGALRRGVPAAELGRVAEACKGWHGIGQARRSLGLLDPRAESVDESCSRVVLAGLQLPPPVLQFEVLDGTRLVGRADFAWPELGTLGEFDGRVKYGRLLRPGESAGDAVFAEKRREDALRDLGWQVVRWVWADLQQPAELRARLERAFARGQTAA